jgi:hypothetical protein
VFFQIDRVAESPPGVMSRRMYTARISKRWFGTQNLQGIAALQAVKLQVVVDLLTHAGDECILTFAHDSVTVPVLRANDRLFLKEGERKLASSLGDGSCHDGACWHSERRQYHPLHNCMQR